MPGNKESRTLFFYDTYLLHLIPITPKRNNELTRQPISTRPWLAASSTFLHGDKQDKRTHTYTPISLLVGKIDIDNTTPDYMYPSRHVISVSNSSCFLNL